MINSLYIFIKYLKTFSVDLWWFFIDFAKFSALREEEGMVGNNNKIWKIFMKLLRSQWCLGTGSKILFLKCFIFFTNLLICACSCIFQFLSSVTLQVGWCHRFVFCQFKHPTGKSRYFSLTLCLHLHSVYLLLGRFPNPLSCVHRSTVSAQWTLQPPGIYIILFRPDMCSHHNRFYSACRTDLWSISSRPYYISLKMAFYA